MTELSKTEFTVLFADVCRSTALFERYGDTKATTLIEEALRQAGIAVVANDGRVIGTIGDEVLAVFRSPQRALQASNDIHQAILDDPELRRFGLRMRIGVHTGPVLVSEATIHGDTVNTAARFADMAKAEQTITSGKTVETLDEDHELRLRPLGTTTIRGKRDEVEIWDVLHDDEEEEITEVRTTTRTTPVTINLDLVFRASRHRLDQRFGRFSLGRHAGCDILVEHPSVSRLHAEIRYVNGEFVLHDVSTNGTHILTERGPRFVHRQAAAIKGTGAIFLGQTFENRHLAIDFSTFGG